jgi:hypothetical protein
MLCRVYSWICLPWIGPLLTLLRKWICVVGEVGYDDTGWSSLIDGVEGIEKLLVVIWIGLDSL